MFMFYKLYSTGWVFGLVGKGPVGTLVSHVRMLGSDCGS